MNFGLKQRKCPCKGPSLQRESDVSQVGNWFGRKGNSLRKVDSDSNTQSKNLNEKFPADGLS